ncbi:hypothetical protein D9756_007948 [Leucocoprinus leucothites]|uniref:Nephrocystin 3-like N-terminal domain-containing protein n=1 Tax=Leucocoprinus leucothites TaxID=201217 RepID=A0A8H5D532_9AGAR|nr:hypothetical protein D9756_007948 [Leucoagaricus leucothites]
MSTLQAHDFVINSPNFNSTQNNYTQSNTTGIDILYEASTPEALVDAEERSYAPSCYDGTREQYIEDITNWATASNEDNAIPPLYWMKGPAAVGKSAVAQTCAERLKNSSRLAAAFFFSVNGRRNDHTRFFPTLAYQLSTTLPDYRDIVNRKIYIDRTLVRKTMASQFKSLIVEPLQELREQGKDVQRRPIIIDGLDECKSTSAQAGIIEIIASSIQAGSTPFRWAIFSREEPHIVSAFASSTISSLCHSVLLPISREADGEIELYLRGGFENILRRRNLFHISPSWPTAKQIQMLVDAAAGLFAHPAIVLRFIDRHSYAEFDEILVAVLNPMLKRGCQSASAYTELDALYMLILQRVPSNILSSTQLLFSHLVLKGNNHISTWFVTSLCNRLGISERHFRSIYHHVQAVMDFQEYPPPIFDETINLERSFFDQDLSSAFKSSVNTNLRLVHGTIAFRHKSFYDFLRDPARSSFFCVTTPAVRQNYFDHLIQQHHHYASSYEIQGSKLVLRSGEASSSAPLSWPQGSKFGDSWIKTCIFLNISFLFSRDCPLFRPFVEDLPSRSLQKLAELDYRKSLLASIVTNRIGIVPAGYIIGLHTAVVRLNENSGFAQLTDYTEFHPKMFLAMVDKLEKLRVIRPYHPRFGSSRAASVLHAVSRQRLFGKKSGLYKLGHKDKSIVWYWEFDTEKRYFHEFETVNYEEAMALYEAKKFTIWDEDEDEDSSNAEDKDGSNVEEEEEEGEEEDKSSAEEEDNSNKEQDAEHGRCPKRKWI